MDGWMDGWVDGWVDGWTVGGWIDRYVCCATVLQQARPERFGSDSSRVDSVTLKLPRVSVAMRRTAAPAAIVY